MQQWRNGAVLLTTDPKRISLEDVERFLRQSYWAGDRSREKIAMTLERSLCFSLIDENTDATIGFARAVTDGADFAWLCDVWIEPGYRGRGFGDWMIASILTHPDLTGLRRIILATSSAHGLYERHGFVTLAQPQLWMERGANPR